MYLYVKLNWDANFFFPEESKDCMKSASYEYRNMSARRGAQFVPMGMPIICCKSWKVMSQKSQTPAEANRDEIISQTSWLIIEKMAREAVG